MNMKKQQQKPHKKPIKKKHAVQDLQNKTCKSTQ